MILESDRREQLAGLAGRMGVDFIDLNLLDQALRHSSFINEHGRPHYEGNERLEFLGDAVLGLVITEELYRRYPDKREGELSKIKSIVVSRKVLARKAQHMSLGEHILLGRGEELTGGRSRKSILANTFESVIGAIFLSSGVHFAQQFILGQLEDEIEKVFAGESFRDHKSELQEILQRECGKLPRYVILDIAGPDHDKDYQVEVCLNGHSLGKGSGKSKKGAEQAAAQQALDSIRSGQLGDLISSC